MGDFLKSRVEQNGIIAKMVLAYQLSVVTLVGAVIYYAIQVMSERRRMKGAKHPPGPKGTIDAPIPR